MNAISFSLYGDNRTYTEGLIRNAELAPLVYPGWQVFVYHDATVPRSCLNELADLGVMLVPDAGKLFPAGLFWRFFIADHPRITRFIIRDADSRLNFRERRAVDNWIESGKKFHVIRDHPFHTPPIGGGLWGATKGALPPMIPLIQKLASRDNKYSSDQTFLASHVWPLARLDCCEHDLRKNFPARGDVHFCGERFDEHDHPYPKDWQYRLNQLTP